jgi:hypothetical protein
MPPHNGAPYFGLVDGVAPVTPVAGGVIVVNGPVDGAQGCEAVAPIVLVVPAVIAVKGVWLPVVPTAPAVCVPARTAAGSRFPDGLSALGVVEAGFSGGTAGATCAVIPIVAGMADEMPGV